MNVENRDEIEEWKDYDIEIQVMDQTFIQALFSSEQSTNQKLWNKQRKHQSYTAS